MADDVLINKAASIERCVQRACEAALDMGFRNVAVHDYQALQLPITTNILAHHLNDFLMFSQQMLHKDAP